MGADQELTAEIAGQKLSLKNMALNTIATVATLIGMVLIGYIVWEHTSDAKVATKELASAMRELAQANREQNCLLRFSPEQRLSQVEFCKQISR